MSLLPVQTAGTIIATKSPFNVHEGRRLEKMRHLCHLLCGQGKDLETHLQRLKSDLHNCVGFIQEPRKLKDSVQMIYARYVPQTDGVSSSHSVVDPSELTGCSAQTLWHQ